MSTHIGDACRAARRHDRDHARAVRRDHRIAPDPHPVGVWVGDIPLKGGCPNPESRERDGGSVLHASP